jgi:tRNA-specific 2-thiouridylase
MKVLVAMSGGVDSSVAAALLKEEGHEIIGATMQLLPLDGYDSRAETDAGQAAQRLDIPHFLLDFRDVFVREVIDNFCREYSLGRTPNPCIRCNRYIKFGALRERARELGTDYIATGHHARVEHDEATGRYWLKKGVDTQKDQSYFLCQLTQEQLSHALFPVGSLTKEKVRQIAGELGLSFADTPESHEICFIPDDDYAKFLSSYMPQAVRPGPILDELGNVLGEHRGITSYTIGQRRGLGLAAAEPLYVTAIEPEQNAVVVGTKEQTYGRELLASNLNWIATDRPSRSMRVKAKVRYRHPEAEVFVNTMDDNRVFVKFDEPQMAITPGQAVAFYDGDTVLGSGIISRRGSQR